MLCRKCGTNLTNYIAKCPKCGTSLFHPIKIYNPEPKKNSNTFIISVLLVIIFLAVGIAVYKMYLMQYPYANDEKNTAEQKTVAPFIEDRASEKAESQEVKQFENQSEIVKSSPDVVEVSKKTEDNQTKRPESPEEKVEKVFHKKQGSHFTVKFEGGESADIGHLIAIILEEAYIKVGSDMRYYPEDRMEAVLYSQQQFTDITRAPGWAGAIYDGRIKIPIGGITSKTTLLERALFHEYSHAIVNRISKGKAPVWLNEGIAQYEEGVVNEHINESLKLLSALEKPLSLRTFEGSFMGFNSNQAAIAYSLSYSATEYIINEFGMSAAIRILERIGDGKSLEDAISSSLHISYEELEKNWYLRLKRKFGG